MSKVDKINPKHYKGDSVALVIEEFELIFNLGNVIKYVLRYKEKDTPLENLGKAKWYLDREIKRLETNSQKNG